MYTLMTAEPNRFLLYNRLKHHTAATSALVVAFLWGLAEGTLFFIIPDVYILFVALFHWRRGLLVTLASVAGSLVGGALMYALAAQDGTAMTALLTHIPLISPQMVETVALRMQTDGLVGMVDGPVQGIPYKVYAVQAGRQSLPFLLFLLMTIPARLERLLPLTLGGAVCGGIFIKLTRHHTKLMIGGYAGLWVGVYILYYLQVR
jgi:membrane protein YqaA with SNARE-associated domain